jgi:riboflavin kinase/FMN adenylyltransferase
MLFSFITFAHYMQIYTDTALPVFNNAVITIGAFDGVHNGHRAIITQLKKVAQQYNGESVIISFNPHPRIVVQPNALLQVITTTSEKQALLQQLQINHLVLYPFSKEFSQMNAQQYVEDFLIAKFKPKAIVIGFDHHFGNDREGNFKLLEKYANQGSFDLFEIEAQTVQNNKISSTSIRNALLHGEIIKANQLLGYNYTFSGTVVKGKQLGRTIGFKTANIQIYDTQKLIPGNGVYVVTATWNAKQLQGMMNIGTRPTVDGTSRTIEVHILNFDEEIYDQMLTVSILQRLRNEQKFDGLEALKNQLQVDKTATAEYFASKTSN